MENYNQPSTSIPIGTPPENGIHLKIKTLLGQNMYDIDANTETTVRDLKRLVVEKASGPTKAMKMNPTNQSLVYGGTVLPDDKRLKNLDLPNNAELLLTPKMRSGPIDHRVKIFSHQLFIHFFLLAIYVNLQINTEALQRHLNKMELEIGHLLNNAGMKEGKSSLHNDEIFVMMFPPDGQARLIKVMRPQEKDQNQHQEQPLEIKLDTWDRLGENDRTRKKMAEVQQKLKGLKERKKTPQPEKDLVFVDAQMIIEESDWDKFVELSAVKKSKGSPKNRPVKSPSTKGSKSPSTKGLKSPSTKVSKKPILNVTDKRKTAETNPNVNTVSEPVEEKKYVSSTASPPVISEPSAAVPPAISHTDEKNVSVQGQVTSDDPESEWDDFFDCADVVDDDKEHKNVWIEFLDWVHRNYFHHIVKELQKPGHQEEDEEEEEDEDEIEK